MGRSSPPDAAAAVLNITAIRPDTGGFITSFPCGTPQPLTARRTAADHNCDYLYCNDADSLQQLLPAFFAARQRATILEIETDADVNSELFGKFKESLQF